MHFDWTISLGNVGSTMAGLVAVGVLWGKIGERLRAIERRQAQMDQEKFGERLAKIELWVEKHDEHTKIEEALLKELVEAKVRAETLWGTYQPKINLLLETLEGLRTKRA